jgi:probable F420-dependent oxidoreductase
MFRFGVNMTSAGSKAEWTAKCQRAEELGYDVILVPDHLGMGAPIPSMMQAASVTTRPRIGTFVLNAGFVNPVVLARDVLAVQDYVDGRLELGIGAGYVRAEFEQAGLGWPSAGDRVSHLERTVTELLDTEVPLLIGGNGDRVLRLAARHAATAAFVGLKAVSGDGELAALSAEELDDRVKFVRAEAGDRQYESNLLIQAVIVTEDRHATAEGLKQEYEMDLSVEQILAVPALLAGTVEEIAEQLRAQRDRYGITYNVVLEPFLETFAPVMRLLTE